MHSGHARHIPSPDDRTIIKCWCGWHEELDRASLGEAGVPWYCNDCGKRVTRFVTFHPFERDAALRELGLA